MIRPMNWRAHLEPDEVMLWQGRATPALRLIAPSQVEWLLGALGAVAVAALAVLRFRLMPADLADGWLLAGLVVLFAALMLAGYPFRQMHQRAQALRRRQYAITDRRVLTATGRPPQIKRATRTPGALPALRTEPTPGLGTLIVPVRVGDPVELPHVKDAAAVLRVLEALK